MISFSKRDMRSGYPGLPPGAQLCRPYGAGAWRTAILALTIECEFCPKQFLGELFQQGWQLLQRSDHVSRTNLAQECVVGTAKGTAG
jgi:hypothetical protein